MDDFINYGIFCEVGIHQCISTIPLFPYRNKDSKFACNKVQLGMSHLDLTNVKCIIDPKSGILYIDLTDMEYIIDTKCITRANASLNHIAYICKSCDCPDMRHGHYGCPNCDHIYQLKKYLSNSMGNNKPDMMCSGCIFYGRKLGFDTEELSASFDTELLRARSPAEN